jgi:hypothetical protein
LGNSVGEVGEGALAVLASQFQVVAEGETFLRLVLQASGFDNGQTTGVLGGLTLPGYLQLEGALLQQGADALCVGQLRGSTDVLETFVGVVALKLSNLTGLSVAEQQELQGVESQNGGVLNLLVAEVGTS